MNRWFALQAPTSIELYSLKMCVIIHDNPYEMGWLITNARVVQMIGDSPYDVANWLGRSVMLLRDHPDLSHVRWPLDKNDFWDPYNREMSLQEIRGSMWQSQLRT